MKSIKAAGVESQALPPRRQRRRFRIRRVQVGEVLQLVILSDRVHWFKVHWWCARTKPCRGDRCRCRQGEPKLTTHWKGYFLAAEGHARGRVLLMEVPAGLAYDQPIFGSERADLRGKVIRIQKENGSVNSGVKLIGMTQSYGVIPAEPCTVLEALEGPWFGETPREQKLSAEWFGDEEESAAPAPADSANK